MTIFFNTHTYKISQYPASQSLVSTDEISLLHDIPRQTPRKCSYITAVLAAIRAPQHNRSRTHTHTHTRGTPFFPWIRSIILKTYLYQTFIPDLWCRYHIAKQDCFIKFYWRMDAWTSVSRLRGSSWFWSYLRCGIYMHTQRNLAINVRVYMINIESSLHGHLWCLVFIGQTVTIGDKWDQRDAWSA